MLCSSDFGFNMFHMRLECLYSTKAFCLIWFYCFHLWSSAWFAQSYSWSLLADHGFWVIGDSSLLYCWMILLVTLSLCSLSQMLLVTLLLCSQSWHCWWLLSCMVRVICHWWLLLVTVIDGEWNGGAIGHPDLLSSMKFHQGCLISDRQPWMQLSSWLHQVGAIGWVYFFMWGIGGWVGGAG